MGSLMLRDKDIARKKGFYALGALGGSIALFTIGSPFLGTIALGGAGYLTLKWFIFRAKRGMRF
jgi:hypothetical protein